MSIWTSITGSMNIEREPSEMDLNPDGTMKFYESGEFEGLAKRKLPYPDKQFKLGCIHPIYETKKERGKEVIIPGFEIESIITSFPVIKKLVDDELEKWPSGEENKVFYMLREGDFTRSSSSYFSSPQTKKLFREAVMRTYPKWYGYDDTWEEYAKYQPVKLDWEKCIEDTILCINDSIRWCKASTLYSCMINLLSVLIDNNCMISNIIFNITDGMETYLIKDDNYGRFIVTITRDDKISYEYYEEQGVKHDDESEDKRYPYKSKLVKVDKFTEEPVETE